MTTIVKISNEGPDYAQVTFYNKERCFKSESIVLSPGETHQVTVHDGNIPVIVANKYKPSDKPRQFFGIPPATMNG